MGVCTLVNWKQFEENFSHQHITTGTVWVNDTWHRIFRKNLTDTFEASTLTMKFQVLLLQVFDSVLVMLTKIYSKTVGTDCHVDLSQREQSLAVAVMTLRRNLTFNFCNKEAQQGLLNPFKDLITSGSLRSQYKTVEEDPDSTRQQ